MRRVVVTGMGAVTPLGLGVEQSWQNAVEGRSGVRPIDFFDATHLKTRMAGVAPPFDLAPIVEPCVPVPEGNRRVRFALAAAEMAVRDAGLETGRLDPGRVGVSFASNETHFYPDRYIPHFCAVYDGGRYDECELARRVAECEAADEMLFQEAQETASLVSKQYGVEGPTASCLTACAAGTQAVGEGLRMVRRGAADVCISGGSDSMFGPIKIVGFSSLGALSRRNDEPERASRPFDLGRDGFVMGEAGAVLVLEELGHALARGARIYAEVVGYGTALETYHLTAMSPVAAGPTAAIRRALADAGLPAERIGYVNAHGTSTVENDAAETLALKNAFGDAAYRVPVSSTKSVTGHLVAAAGAVEAIFTVLALRDGVAPPTINYETPDPACDLDYVPNEARQVDADFALSNSFGFGGQNAALVVGRFTGAR